MLKANLLTSLTSFFSATIALLLTGAKKLFSGLNVVLAHSHTPLIAIAIAATLLRLIYWHNSSLPSDPNLLQTNWSDEGIYSSIALYIITHGFWDYFFAEPSVVVAPGTPVYLALIYPVVHSVPAGTVMLAALPILMGAQLILAFLGYDISNVPRRPFHKMRRNSKIVKA